MRQIRQIQRRRAPKGAKEIKKSAFLFHMHRREGEEMNWILDGIVAAVILGCAIAAWRKGFILAVLGFLPMAMALLGTRILSPYVGRFLRETFLFDKMSETIQESMGLDAVLREGAMQTQTELITAMPLPDFLKGALLENNNPVIYQLLHADSLKEYIAGFLANICMNIISVAVTFLLIYIAARVVIQALHLFSRLPVLHFLNRFSGFFVGSVKGIVCVWLGGMVLTFFQCNAAFAGLFSAMEQTVFAKYLYENNLLLHLILTIFT